MILGSNRSIILELEAAATVCLRVCVCVLARGAAPSSGRGLWFVIDDLYTPPTRC